MAPVSTRHLPRVLDEAAKEVARVLGDKGYRAWIVGGAVRDLLLGRKVNDVDMTSDARPEVIEQLFEHTVGVGKAFGTVIVVLGEVNIEVTTFRADGCYSDGRRPDAITYSKTPQEDATRRDFTCNAIFLDPLTEELLDPTGGEDDLAQGLLQTVGDPKQRFEEDALRLMRLARFAARLDLDVPSEVSAAAKACAPGLANVSPERILDELSKVLVTKDCHVAVKWMLDLELLKYAIPGLPKLHCDAYDDQLSLQRRVATLEWLESNHLASGLAVLLDPLGGDKETARATLAALRPSKNKLREVEALWELLDQIEALDPMEHCETNRGPDRASRLRILGHPAWPRARDLCAAYGDARCHDQELEGGHLGRNGRELSLFESELTIAEITPEALLEPKDLEAAGLPKGKLWGETLAAAYQAQLEGDLNSRGEAITWLSSRPQA
ncbi:MAG: CCA tRNA nucleotidyltransferase [Planctomycetota bacterium]|nr:CCA tRNA nucleotidyltransferase [Planctomycetota bacterium]MDG2143460.1 CCA tRNA nucleotidyltransferase [Planctomycetota bacterium]